jgi:hypothetical protein
VLQEPLPDPQPDDDPQGPEQGLFVCLPAGRGEGRYHRSKQEEQGGRE